MSDQLSLLMDGLAAMLLPFNIFLLILGTFIGIVVGAIPGLSAITALACFLPLTFSMGPEQAIILFISVYVGANFGNAIPSVLLGLPGTPSAVMTAYEGYILQRQGRGAEALGVTLYTSVAGQLFGGLVVVLLLVPTAKIAVNFLFPEVFAIGVLALIATAGLLGGNPLLGLASGIFGLVLSTVGTDVLTGSGRFAFGNIDLAAGFDTVGLIVGFLIVGETMFQMLSKQDDWKPPASREFSAKGRGSLLRRWFGVSGWHEFVGTWRASLAGYVAGLVIGVLPGVGGSVGSVVAYQQSKLFAKEPEKYGHGSYEALSAADGAGNVETATSAVPSFAFGIPGSPVMVIMLAALTIHGITPGPGLMKSEPASIAALLATLLIAPLALFVVGLVSIKPSVYIASLPTQPIRVVALILSLVGIYSLHWNMFEVGVCAAIGLLSYLMRRLEIPVLPAAIGVLLGAVLERNLRVGLSMAGSVEDFFTRPWVLVLLGLAILSLVYPYLRVLTRLYRGLPKEDQAAV
jgi:putative tricarboxylic transport membrane protein